MIWTKYEKCKSLMEENGLINRVNEQWDFCYDNQWNVGRNTPISTSDPLPFFNIIKSSVKFQLSTIASNQMIPTFNYNSGGEDEEGKIQVAKLLNKKLHDDWKLSKQSQKSWDVLKQGLISGDSYQYCGTADPKDDQVIMNTNIFFGDESNSSIQDQPYIMIRERLLVEDVKAVAKKNGLPQSDIDTIQADTDDQYLINNNIKKDVEGKVTSILYMEKRDGNVWWGKSIKNLEYVPLKPIKSTTETASGQIEIYSKLYPVASFLPEDEPNSARSKGSVRPMIANQIKINKTIAQRSAAVQLSAFPRMAYNQNAVTNPDDLDRVGSKIGVDGSVDDIRAAVGYLNPVSSSSDAANLQADLISITRELNGSVDALTGATDPTRVSGQAVYAMVAQTEKALGESTVRYKQFVEDLTLIRLDQLRVYYPDGITVDEIFIPGEALRDTKLEVSIDVSQDTPWTRGAEKAFLDDWLSKGIITPEQYVDLVPDQSEVPKAKLKKMFDEMKQQKTPTQEVPNATPV